MAELCPAVVQRLEHLEGFLDRDEVLEGRVLELDTGLFAKSLTGRFAVVPDLS
jgi:hypothetical protein